MHYIPVNMDLSNLLEQVEWMKKHNDKCIEMANNAFEFAINHFTEDKLLERVYHIYQNSFAKATEFPRPSFACGSSELQNIY